MEESGLGLLYNISADSAAVSGAASTFERSWKRGIR